ncbi:virulence-associated E family protein [Aneurinibacillus aneurinilyticus]|uniref:Virulence-associated protein E n=1 Tax=Aneurinibacillus aneurinilyticus ATCC 12856 TaxID=649747 RepID=U1WW57_ANEAE|nr:virulence-associated E family protein [Aneurinibacillus aneurinilyticus]ERI06483.1 Virulence-associated protein E [Aneurinibacillus aneurinilyticus ATCC 12856]MED0707098.1 virulence-associated E family protein [Aneurinibacillus aneurinilyticus]MED0732833.1 virulence-associated E family protein [Aneurinibacillus aneurinilyticus]MED0740397.1 virulence-associated E family protein [Aneurinibacillus aneurinilyticus]
MNDIELDISFGKHRADTNWKPEYLTWEEFVDKLRKVRRTNETMAQYDKMHNIGRGKIKDGPAFVGGLVRGGRRKKENIDTRSLITLDVDHADSEFMFTLELVLGGTAYAVYSTHSHRPNKPKYRLIMPVDRVMSPDEYAAVSRKLAEQIGMDYFDKTTFDVHRLMYLPSCSKDAEPVLNVYEGEPVCVDAVLDEYEDWQDPLQWPRHKGDKLQRKTAERMEDPRAKEGVVGAFCRCYSISEAIATFLSDVYEPIDDSLTRYTHIGSTSHGGLVVYDEDTFAYSHHESDPCSGREVNAFDLVRLHKFGKLDDRASERTNITKLPSYTAMLAFATQDVKVKRERLAELSEDFADMDVSEGEGEDPDIDWISKLKVNEKTGFPLSTARNAEIILSNGPFKGVLAYDAFGNTEVIRKPLPWRDREYKHEDYEPWLGADDRRLEHWLGKTYEFKSSAIIKNAFTEVAHANKFHPIIEYLEAQEWDGVERLDSLCIHYLGAEDSAYVREVTRKMLVAAVKRLYEPGCKFDYMLVLVGPQGAGKSTIIQMLAQRWFSDSLKTFDTKEAGEHLQSAWIFEFGELAGMSKTEVDEIKQFITKRSDKYRVAYDRVITDFPRKCVFFGTTNNWDFLKDPTGNRRFWPVTVDPTKRTKNMFTELSEYEIGQIWAEALQAYRNGEGLTLSPEVDKDAARIQGLHMEEDPRVGLIQEWLDMPIEDEWGEESEGGQLRNRVCASQIWVECFHNKAGSIRPWEAREIVSILRRIPGWKERKGRARVPGYGLQTVFDRV